VIKLERSLVNKGLKLIKEFLRNIAGLVATGEIGLGTFDWAKRHIETQLNEYVKIFREELDKKLLSLFEWSIREAHADLNIAFRGIPVDTLTWFHENFSKLEETVMKNYAGDLMRKVENTLLPALITGTPADEVVKILRFAAGATSLNRISVMVRDQLGHAMQQGTWRTYERYQDIIEGYRWVGPSDNRTTEWCRNRKNLTRRKPWTHAEVQKYIRTNPLKLCGKEIRARHGTFLHPHIQCRHRLIAIPKPVQMFVRR